MGKTSGKAPPDKLAANLRAAVIKRGEAAFHLGKYAAHPATRAADVPALASLCHILTYVLEAQPSAVLNAVQLEQIVLDILEQDLGQSRGEAAIAAKTFSTQLRIALSHFRILAREPQRFRARCNGVPEESVKTMENLFRLYSGDPIPPVPSSWERIALAPKVDAATTAPAISQLQGQASTTTPVISQLLESPALCPTPNPRTPPGPTRHAVEAIAPSPDFGEFTPTPECPASHELTFRERAELREIDAQRASKQVPLELAGLLMDYEIVPRPGGFRSAGQSAAVARAKHPAGKNAGKKKQKAKNTIAKNKKRKSQSSKPQTSKKNPVATDKVSSDRVVTMHYAKPCAYAVRYVGGAQVFQISYKQTLSLKSLAKKLCDEACKAIGKGQNDQAAKARAVSQFLEAKAKKAQL